MHGTDVHCLITVVLIGQVPWIFSEYVDCNMRRKGYVSSANVMKVNVSFDAVTVSSSIKCAMLSLRQGNSTIGFLYDRVASSCRGKMNAMTHIIS